MVSNSIGIHVRPNRNLLPHFWKTLLFRIDKQVRDGNNPPLFP
jgi:hypothetical protein